MKKKAEKIDREVVENMMVDTTRLRAALMLACLELTQGDLIAAIDLSEELYDTAPKLLEGLNETGLDNLPCGPAKVLPFPKKTSN
ncbi:MAG: hypothetical protein DKT66_28500 [Candidatus Melainabacteria bacterium]|nr:MAG: hypothetical protein DKT66_28500 [Candidatus Melainabacteria bacterium]